MEGRQRPRVIRPHHGAPRRGSHEGAVRRLNQRSPRRPPVCSPGEVVQRGEIPGGVDTEDRPAAARAGGARAPRIRRTVEVAVERPDRSGEGLKSVGSGEAMKRPENSGRTQLEDGSPAVRAAVGGGSIEVAIARLDEAGWALAEREAEAVERRESTGGIDLENGAAEDRRIGGLDAVPCRPVQKAVRSLN